MRKLTFNISAPYDGKPLLHFFKDSLKLSGYLIRHLKNTDGSVKVNGQDFRVIDIVRTGDELIITVPEKTTAPPLWDYPLDIIYEDDDILAVNKPSGISTHPTAKHPNGTLCNAVASYLQKMYSSPAAGRAIGRLDKVTSGVMIFAKNSFAAAKLNGKQDKTYNALVWGTPPERGTIDAPVFRPDMGLTLRCVDERGDKAVTHYSVLKQFAEKALVEVKTQTGRTHQIRVHFLHIGHPLVGDELYNSPVTENLNHAALHCKSITITHPVTEKVMTFEAELPGDMKKELLMSE